MYLNRPTTIDFDIEPRFVDFQVFESLCAALAVGLLLIAYRLRVRQIAQRQHQRMVERSTSANGVCV